MADSLGSILAYDALCRSVDGKSRHGSENSILDDHKGLSCINYRVNVLMSGF